MIPRFLGVLVIGCVGLLLGGEVVVAQMPYPAEVAQSSNERCYDGLSVPGVKLKDHTLFYYDGYYYVASINVPLPEADDTKEQDFIYARTADFCSWDVLGTILGIGDPGDPDEFRIWAPYVFHEGDTYYMFYTGVNRNIAQSTMLATSTNPADLQSWVRHGEVFRPDHHDTVYGGAERWSDNRDPMVLKYNNRYYMYYTSSQEGGGIVGLAVANDLMGPWQDLGAILEGAPGNWPESPFVVAHNDYFYLYYNGSGSDSGQRWHYSFSPFGPWREAVREPIGWAYDFYYEGDEWLASYLVGNGREIQVSPVEWDTSVRPAIPQVTTVSQVYIPLLLNE